MTPQDAMYLSEACQDLSSTTEDYSDSYIGLDRSSACLQQDLILIDSYVQQLRNQREYYESQLIKQHEVVNK